MESLNPRVMAARDAKRCEEHLEICENAWRAGVMEAIADAIAWCHVLEQPPPAWLAQAAYSVRDHLITSRSDQEKERHDDEMRHYERYSVVEELRERRVELSKLRGKIEYDIEPDASWLDCWHIAAEFLTNHGAACSWHTVQKSYAHVRREIKAGRGAKYYQPLPPY